MTLIFGLLYDDGLLHRFLRYYAQLGVSRFICQLHDPLIRDRVEAVLAEYDYILRISEFGLFNGLKDSLSQDVVRLEHVSANAWYAVADLDEFHYHPGYPTLEALRAAVEAAGCDYVHGEFVDRIAQDGSIPRLSETESLDSQFPLAADVTKIILGGLCSKVMLARGTVPIGTGHHKAAGKPFPLPCEVHHFKWAGSLMLQRLHVRMRAYRDQGLGWYVEPERFFRHFAEHQRIDIEHPALKVRRAAVIGA